MVPNARTMPQIWLDEEHIVAIMNLKQDLRRWNDQRSTDKELEGEIEVAKADLRIFLANPIGVAEHIDYVITAEKKLEALAHAEDKLESLNKL